MLKVNPKILQWARETAGLTIEDAVEQLKIQPIKGTSQLERLHKLESGDIQPTKQMLVNMSKKYHRPLIVFYLEKPPAKSDRGEDFRTLPRDFSSAVNGLVDALVRDVLVRQSILKSAIEDDEDIKMLPFVGSVDTKIDAVNLASTISTTLHFNLDQFRKQSTPDDAFKYLRGLVENAEIFVLILGNLGSYHTNIEAKMFRGFTLSDNIAPFIVINENDSKSAWSFTLLHELAHLWLGQTGISNEYSNLAIEKFCNNVASEILLPSSELNALDNISNNTSYDETKDKINSFARDRNISSTMVAYKLLLHNNINPSTWEKLRDDFYSLWLYNKIERKKKFTSKKSGPSYLTLRNYSLGKHLISFVNQMMRGGDLSTSKASKVLGVSPTNLQKLTKFETSLTFGGTG